MRRFLTGALPEHPLPDGLELRPVRPEDHRAIWDADCEAFRDHWGHREPTDGDFVARFAAPETNTALWSVAWDGDQVAGSVMTAIFTEENEALGIKRGWLEHVSVRRPWRGRGLAKALCADAFRVLRDHGIEEAWLGVDGTNPTGALQLYEGLGLHGRPPLAGVRAADGRPGTRGLDLGRGGAPGLRSRARRRVRAGVGPRGGRARATARSRPIVVAAPCPGSTRRWSSSSARRVSDSTI